MPDPVHTLGDVVDDTRGKPGVAVKKHQHRKSGVDHRVNRVHEKGSRSQGDEQRRNDPLVRPVGQPFVQVDGPRFVSVVGPSHDPTRGLFDQTELVKVEPRLPEGTHAHGHPQGHGGGSEHEHSERWGSSRLRKICGVDPGPKQGGGNELMTNKPGHEDLEGVLSVSVG